MEVIDTHSHFNLEQFGEDYQESILRMEDAGVGTICIGVDLATSEKAVALATAHKSIWAIVGQHPTEWDKDFDIDSFEKLAGDARVVGIGECGIDYYRETDRTENAKDIQKLLFMQHIEIAHEANLPLMLHIRPEQGTMDAYEDVLNILEKHKEAYPDLRGTAHFFVGNTEIAQRFLDIGFYISFSGVITLFPEYEEVVRFVPIERILPETDSPFAAPKKYRGQRNEPAYVIEVVEKIAELKNHSYEETKAILLQNTKRLFVIDF
jgi:TatD DNase family protein